jgi:hypothetical protein
MLGPALIAAYAFAMAAWAAFGSRAAFPFAAEAPPGIDARTATRRLLAVLGLCLAACCVTPYGLHGLALPFKLFARLVPGAGNVYAGNVAENVPPWVVERAAPGQFEHLVWYLVLLARAW